MSVSTAGIETRNEELQAPAVWPAVIKLLTGNKSSFDELRTTILG